MPPLAFIRKQIFELTQAEMAVIAGVTQGTISKWEAGSLEPSRTEMKRIRDEAERLGKAWDDRWFFVTVPVQQSGAAA